MFNLFKRKKSIQELQTEKDIVLYTLDTLLSYELISLDEYNRILVQGMPYFRGEEDERI